MRSTPIVLAGIAAGFVAAGSAGFGTAGAADKDAAGGPTHEALVELGRRLFMDPAASRAGRNSCASCHDPERGFSDPRTVSIDDSGPTRRHSQTLIDLAGTGFHWDGEFDTVRELLVARIAPVTEATTDASNRVQRRVKAAQSERPGKNLEFRVPSFNVYYDSNRPRGPITPSAERLAYDGRYAEAFTATFGTTTPTTGQIVDAMDAYCASIRSASNAFDRFRAGDDAALTASAKRGLAIFEGKAGCATCHVTRSETGRAPFSDGKFHDTGVSTREEAMKAATIAAQPTEQISAGSRRLPGTQANGAVRVVPDLGLQETTFLARNGRRFKTPALRDVASHAPYMHDGSFATLKDVVRYYSAGGTPHDGLDAAVKKLDLTDADVDDVVAFLEALTGDVRAGLGFSSPDVKPLTLKVLGTDGRPMKGLRFDVKPFGDRLLGETPADVAASATTSADGTATFWRPLATHVELTSPTHFLDRPIPDTCSSRTIIAVPRNRIALRVRRHPSYPAFPDEIDVGGRFTFRRAVAIGKDEVLYVADAIPGGKDTDCSFTVSLDEYHVTLPLGGGMAASVTLNR